MTYANARYLQTGVHDFISEDPVFYGKQDLTNPQSFNTYAYANNNPMRYTDPSGLSVKTYAQGAAKQTAIVTATAALTVALAALYVATSPVTVPATAVAALGIAASALGIAATGIGTYNNYQAYQSGAISRDQFDYNNGALTINGATSIVGAFGSGNAFRGALVPQITKNALQGSAFEALVASKSAGNFDVFTSQVLLETQSGVRTKIDFLAINNGTVTGIEAKSSLTASLTQNQKLAFPEIGITGATVRSWNNPFFPYGTQLDPFIINVVRPD